MTNEKTFEQRLSEAAEEFQRKELNNEDFLVATLSEAFLAGAEYYNILNKKRLANILQHCYDTDIMSKALVCEYLEIPLIDFDLHFKK